eukprot:6068092-Amphidinium_carterae.1
MPRSLWMWLRSPVNWNAFARVQARRDDTRHPPLVRNVSSADRERQRSRSVRTRRLQGQPSQVTRVLDSIQAWDDEDLRTLYVSIGGLLSAGATEEGITGTALDLRSLAEELRAARMLRAGNWVPPISFGAVADRMHHKKKSFWFREEYHDQRNADPQHVRVDVKINTKDTSTLSALQYQNTDWRVWHKVSLTLDAEGNLHFCEWRSEPTCWFAFQAPQRLVIVFCFNDVVPGRMYECYMGVARLAHHGTHELAFSLLCRICVTCSACALMGLALAALVSRIARVRALLLYFVGAAFFTVVVYYTFSEYVPIALYMLIFHYACLPVYMSGSTRIRHKTDKPISRSLRAGASFAKRWFSLSLHILAIVLSCTASSASWQNIGGYRGERVGEAGHPGPPRAQHQTQLPREFYEPLQIYVPDNPQPVGLKLSYIVSRGVYKWQTSGRQHRLNG